MARETNPGVMTQYIRSLLPKCDLLEEIRESAPEWGRAMQIAPEEGQLIYMLLKLFQAERVVEIGAFVGYSTLWIAKALPEHGKVISFEKEVNQYMIARQNINKTPQGAKVELINNDAGRALEYVRESSCDAVFIDAKKQSYPEYLDIAYKILRKGGIVIADNIFLFGAVYDDKVTASIAARNAMREFNLKLFDNSRFESVIIPTDEGLSLSIKI